MTYKTENLTGCSKKLQFTFDQLDLTKQIKEALIQKQKTVSLKGFRKGHAPLAVLEKLYRPQLESEALNKFIQQEFYKAIQDEKLKVVGEPTIENMKYEEGKSVSFDAVVELFPEVQLSNMDKLMFTKELPTVSDEDIDSMKKRYLESKAQMVPMEEAGVSLEKGHHAVMNFQGIMPDGSRPENMGGKEFPLEIGSGQFIPGFEEGMLGMKAAEKKSIELVFPADYHAPELKGAAVTFEVELLEIKQKKYPEFTDEFAKEVGYESVEDFKKKTHDNLFYQKDRQSKEKLHQEVLERLIQENHFDVPRALVIQQELYVRKDTEANLKQQGFNEAMIKSYMEKLSDELTKKAEFQVRSGLILDKVGRDYSIEATEDDLNAKISETAKYSGMDEEKVREYYTSDKRTKQNLMYSIREEKTFAKILEIAKFVEA